MLVDTGPIVALITKSDQHHQTATSIFATIKEPLTTTVACLTEALYFLGSADGWRAQSTLWEIIRDDLIAIHNSRDASEFRASKFMERFWDIPCDYADATLLVAAEELNERSILTFDKHFHAYRLTNGRALDVRL